MTETYEPTCPYTIDRAVMLHRWEELAFLHWRFEPETVQRLLPEWLTVEPYEEAAWVGLVPFRMHVASGRDVSLPWISDFCETNVRTYVRDEAGRSGIWFFSLDAERLAAVVTARATYRLPYFWSHMRLERAGDEITYTCGRRWPAPAGVHSRVRLRVGEPFASYELTSLDHFLTARWVLFSSRGSRHRFARAQHDTWPLQRAALLEIDDGLLEAAGLPSPSEEPLMHFAEGVRVRIGVPERYASGVRRPAP